MSVCLLHVDVPKNTLYRGWSEQPLVEFFVVPWSAVAARASSFFVLHICGVTPIMAQLLPPLNLPEGIILLITDELSAPADFVLHRTLANHLKRPLRRGDGSEARALILSVSEDYGKWKALASKSVSFLM